MRTAFSSSHQKDNIIYKEKPLHLGTYLSIVKNTTTAIENVPIIYLYHIAWLLMLLGLAPMDGITDCPYRLIVQDIFQTFKNPNDTLWTRTEFMSADGYMINPSRLVKHLVSTQDEPHLIAQIYGWNEDTLAQTTQDIIEKYPFFQWIELNIGCPSPKVIACWAGSGMMRDKEYTLWVIKTLSQVSTIPFSIKTRIWLHEEDKSAQYKFIVEASQYCQMITIHGRTFNQWHHGTVDWKTLTQLRTDMDPRCLFIANGGISSYDEAQHFEQLLPTIWAGNGVMIGQAAIGNPWIFTPHLPTHQEKIQTAIDHFYLLSAYMIYMEHTRLTYPEQSDESLLSNKSHLHIAKKYNPDSDEYSNIPPLQRHNYIFPMPDRWLLTRYTELLQKNRESWQTLVDIGDCIRDVETLRSGIDIRKYLFHYIAWLPNNKQIKQQIISTTKLYDILAILYNAL